MPREFTDNSDFLRGRGRPSAKNQAEMKQRLRLYYDMNLSAQAASKQPGMPSDKTCEKYFRLWTEKYLDEYQEDIAERQKNAKIRMLVTYDKLILNLYIQLNKFTGLIIDDQKQQEFEIRKNDFEGKPSQQYRPNSYYEGMYKGLISDIAALTDAKTALEMQPTIDEEQEKRILEKLKKNQEV